MTASSKAGRFKIELTKMGARAGSLASASSGSCRSHAQKVTERSACALADGNCSELVTGDRTLIVPVHGAPSNQRKCGLFANGSFQAPEAWREARIPGAKAANTALPCR